MEYCIVLFEIIIGNDLCVLVVWGDLGGVLMGFVVKCDSWVGELCILYEVELYEISIV